MFKVTKRFTSRSESFLQEFKQEVDAENFIKEKLREDRHYRVTAVYCLYEWDELIREYTQNDTPTEISSTSEGSQQKGSGISFNPTPFNTAPRIPGMPHSWVKDEEDKKK